MKKFRLLTFLVFAVCAFSLPAQAQKKWTYKGDNGVTDRRDREEITLIITQRPNGYEVSGEYTYDAGTCKLRGSYLPAGQRLRAICVFSWRELEVTGFKQAGKDAFQVNVPDLRKGELVAWRDGIKPKTADSSTESSSTTGCGVGRVWDDLESGHSMTWTRIGDSNQFIVAGTVNGQNFSAKQDIFIAGNKVTINRFEASDGNTCNFQGTITGGTASGTYACTKFKPSSGWSATIHCK